MGVGELCRRLLQAALFPQACVICQDWVCNPDFSPLCAGCLERLPPIVPPICEQCGVPTPVAFSDAAITCSQCREDPPPFDFARAWGTYAGELRELLRHFKFGGLRRLSSPLGLLLERTLARTLPVPKFDWIVPVPLHPKRHRQRGYDQTWLLAKVLAERISTPIFEGLVRTRDTAPQFGLSRPERRKNLRAAFRLNRGEILAGGSLLIVDDILTTGTTVQEVCSLLRKAASFERVGVVTVARTSKMII